jgi:transcriptional regulator with XRE-family HTH domain
MTRSGRSGRDAARSLKTRPTELLAAMTEVRIQAGLSQERMAELMCTDRSCIVRLENGRTYNPTLMTLEQWAKVTGKKLEIRFV